MTLLSGSFTLGLAGWLADFYLLATLLMLAALLARRWTRQPSQRLTVDWIVAVELATLAVVCALPFWPRIPLLAPASAKAAKSVVEPPQAAELPIPVEPPIAADHGPLAMPRATWSPAIKPEPVIDAPLKPAAPPTASEPSRFWIELTAAAYLACAAIVVLWLAWGAIALALACRRADYAPRWLQAELSRTIGDGAAVPRLLVSSRAKTAVALGLRRPTILLPAGLIHGGPTPALRAVLAHEWAHIRSGDLWLLALGRCLLVLLFAHPLFWWWRRMIRGDQELLADAAAAGDDRPAYAEELLRLVRKAAYAWPLAASASVGIWEGSSQLLRRIAMLLDENFCIEPKTSSGWRYRALGLLAVLGAAASLLTFQPGQSAGEEGPGNAPVTLKADSADAKEAYEADQARAIAEIEKLGGKVARDETSPEKVVMSVDFQKTKLTDAGLKHVAGLAKLQSLNLSETAVTDAGLKHLQGLTNLQTLDLVGTGVTDAGLVYLKGLSQLKVLSLGGLYRVTDRGLRHLDGLTRLESLGLGATRVTDVGLKHLCGLVRLQSLELTGTNVTDAGLEHIEELTQLQWLELGCTNVTDSGLKRLKGMANLQTLGLWATKVSDAGVEHLRGVRNLQCLDLGKTTVTDASLESLRGLTKLQGLTLYDTKVTDAGVKKFQQALPKCRISFTWLDMRFN